MLKQNTTMKNDVLPEYEYFVAFVLVDDDGRLGAGVYRLSHVSVWDAEDRRRFVVAATGPSIT